MLYLIKTIILGMDWISLTAVVINFNMTPIQMNINNEQTVIKFEEVTQEGILCYITGNNKNCDNMINNYISNESIKGSCDKDYDTMNEQTMLSESIIDSTL